MTPERVEETKQHIRHSRQYLKNALDALAKGEAGKAGELLWSSVAQAVHALATSRDRTIGSHRDLKSFAIQVSKESDGASFLKDFALAESLHQDFYVIKQEPIDIEVLVPSMCRILSRVSDFVPPQALNGTADA